MKTSNLDICQSLLSKRLEWSKCILFIVIMLVFTNEMLGQRVIVISGGGARGAWGGGVAESLHKKCNFNYELAIGTSTGSLLAPFVISKNFDEVKESYTNVTQRSIFNVNPFKNKPGKEDDVKFLPAIFRIIFGKKTIGESKNLRKLILRDMPIDVYEEMLEHQFMVTVVNFTTADIRYFSNQEYDTRGYNCEELQGKEQKRCQKKKDSVYNEMVNWIWASGNQPIFMSLLQTKTDTASKKNLFGNEKPKVDRHYWVDGGVRENIAVLRGIQYIMKNGIHTKNDTIDAIINNTPHPNLDSLKSPKILKSLFRTISILTYDTRQNDLRIPGECTEVSPECAESSVPTTMGSSGNIVINMYFMREDTYKTHPKDLAFNIEGMTRLWELGNDFEHSAEMKSSIISKDDANLLIEDAVINRKVYVQSN